MPLKLPSLKSAGPPAKGAGPAKGASAGAPKGAPKGGGKGDGGGGGKPAPPPPPKGDPPGCAMLVWTVILIIGIAYAVTADRAPKAAKQPQAQTLQQMVVSQPQSTPKPPPAGCTGVYTVKKDDTLAGIAAATGYSQDLLLYANPVLNIVLSPGMELCLPDALHRPAAPLPSEPLQGWPDGGNSLRLPASGNGDP